MFLVSALVVVSSSPTSVGSTPCHDALDAYCNVPANCLDAVHGKFNGPLTALHDGPGAHAWRCYASTSLNVNRTKYVSGGDYCSRDAPLRALNAKPPCNGTLPPTPPTPAPLAGVTVFAPNMEKGVACYRIPSIIQTKSGVLLAFAEARFGSCGDSAVHEISLRRSLDGGTTWTAPRSAVGNATYLVGNPTAVALSNGDAMLIYVKHSPKCEGDCGTGNGLVVSSDDGLTWSAPHDLSAQWGNASGSLPGPGTALQLASETESSTGGRILVPSHHEAYQRDYVSYSDDGGGSWQTIAQDFPKMDEAAMTQLPNGSVLLNMRYQGEGRGVARSEDGGLTFGPVVFDKTLISPVCQASIVSFRGVTYFSNPASTTGRDHTTIRRSTDNAVTWSSELLVEAASSAGYSCLVKGALLKPKAGGGEGGILYEAVSSTIKFSRFPLEF